jgi:hypothetical protein
MAESSQGSEVPTIAGMSWVTPYGVAALTFMMVMYWLEQRGPVFLLGFALGCLLSSIYGFLAGAWPFGVLEAIWCLIAVRRYAARRPGRAEVPVTKRGGAPPSR